MSPILRLAALLCIIGSTLSMAQENRWVRASNPTFTATSRLLHLSNAIMLTGSTPALSADQGASWTPLTGVTGEVVSAASIDANVHVCVTDTEDDSVRLFYSVTGVAWEPLENLPQTGVAVDIGAQGLTYIVALRDGRVFRRTEEEWTQLPATGLSTITRCLVSADAVVVTDGSAIKILLLNDTQWTSVPTPSWKINSMRLHENTLLITASNGAYVTALSQPELLRISMVDIGPILSSERHLGENYFIALDQPLTPSATHLRLFRYQPDVADWFPLADTIPGIAEIPADVSGITVVDAGRMVLLHHCADTAAAGVYVIDLAVANSVQDDVDASVAPWVRDGVMTLPTTMAGSVTVYITDISGRMLDVVECTAFDNVIQMNIAPAWRGPLGVTLRDERGSVQRHVVMP